MSSELQAADLQCRPVRSRNHFHNLIDRTYPETKKKFTRTKEEVGNENIKQSEENGTSNVKLLIFIGKPAL